MRPDLMVTLWPSFPHFKRFAHDRRLAGIGLNSAMITLEDLERELKTINEVKPTAPLYFDIKGRQLRVIEVLDNPDYLDVRLNHPVDVEVPTVILLKAGADQALLGSISEDGYRLTMKANPRYRVKAGESLHIRVPHSVRGDIFTELEREKIKMVRASGLIHRWFLSYVEKASDVEEFRSLIGEDAELLLKIESQPGLQYVSEHWDPMEAPPKHTRLVAACGDLFVEVERPHHIIGALRLISARNVQALVGSRILLSIVQEPVPSFADIAQLQWLREMGYEHFMLCDELCLKEDLLATAINVFCEMFP